MYKEIHKYLKKNLTDERYEHTLGVAYTAAAMAMRYNPQPENDFFMQKALIAGLLHDCAKCMSNEKKLKICDKHHIAYSQVEADNPYLLHGKVGAYVAKHKLGIEDEDILGAITWHTTGKPGMSLLEKIIFVADYIEPSRRPLPELDEIRRLSMTDLDSAVIRILYNTLHYLESKGSEIDVMTQRTYDSYAAAAKKEENAQ